jgi:hypothetical protein
VNKRGRSLLSREDSVLERQILTKMGLESDLCFEQKTFDNAIKNVMEGLGIMLMDNLRGLEYFH